MRVFQPSYTVAKPPKARILVRRDGRYVRFVNKRGQEIEGKLSKSGKRVLLETRCWHIEFDDHQGIPRRLKGFTDRSATDRLSVTIQDLLNSKGSGSGIGLDLQRRLEGLPQSIRADLAQWGLLGERAMIAAKPLTELVAAYEMSMQAKERTVRHVSKTVADVKAVCEACGFHFFSDIDGGRIERHLKERRQDGIGYCRSNAILTSVKGFCSWAVQSGYVSDSPVKLLKKLNAKEDRRRIRRVLEVDELRRLLEVTAASEQRYELTGPERALVYRFAAETGLRANEIRTLTVGCLDWDTLTIELEGRHEKNKKGNVLPLKPSLAAELRAYVGERPPTARVFDRFPRRQAEMLRADLAEAGIPYIDESGRPFDFHALRSEFGSLLVNGGVHPKTTQVLMRHGSIELTMGLYTHLLRGQEAQAVASLPDLSPRQEQQGLKTGTDDQVVR